jgi:hypothetical protein
MLFMGAIKLLILIIQYKTDSMSAVCHDGMWGNIVLEKENHVSPKLRKTAETRKLMKPVTWSRAIQR